MNALLTTAWAPLLFPNEKGFDDAGAGYLLSPNARALHWCGFDDSRLPTRPLGRPPCHQYYGTGGPVYPPRLVHLCEQDEAAVVDFGTGLLWQPDRGLCAATAPYFSLQRDFSGYYDCPDSQNDCTLADGSGYYVVPAGDIIPEGMSTHVAFIFAFLADGGEKWHADAAFNWLGNGVWRLKSSSSPCFLPVSGCLPCLWIDRREEDLGHPSLEYDRLSCTTALQCSRQ